MLLFWYEEGMASQNSLPLNKIRLVKELPN
jgi:hypothetical protein